MKNIELPTGSDDISPTNPDLQRLWKMLGMGIGILIASYGLLVLFANIFIASLDIQEEKALFGEIFSLKTEFNTNILQTKIDIPYSIYIQPDTDEINAFALPGGVIYVTQALLDNITYEEEFIFILGHEIRHIENRDVLKKYIQEIPFTVSLYYLGLDSIFDTVNISGVTSNYLSKNTEISADQGGFDLVNKQGKNLGCVLGFFESEGEGINYLGLFSDHPSNILRINNMKKNIKYSGECTQFVNKKSLF